MNLKKKPAKFNHITCINKYTSAHSDRYMECAQSCFPMDKGK